MRIPEIRDPWMSAPSPRINPLGGAVADFGQSLVQIASQELAQQKQVADTQAATKIWLDTNDEFTKLNLELQNSPDYNTHMDRWENGWWKKDKDGNETWVKGAKEIEKDALGRAENSQVSNFLQGQMARFKLVETEKQRVTKNNLFQSQSRSELNDTLSEIENKAITANTVQEYEKLVSNGMGLIAGHKAGGALKPEEAQKRTEQFLRDMELGVIRKDMNEYPLEAAERLESGYYTKIDGKTAVIMANQSRAIYESRERKRITEENRIAAETEKYVKDTQNENAFKLSISINNNRYTRDDIELLAQRREITREQYEHAIEMERVRDERLAKKIEVKSNPEVVQRILPDLRSSAPKTTQKQLDDFWISGDIDRKDYDEFSGILDRKRVEGKDTSKADIRFRHTQAEQSGLMALTTTGPQEKFDPISNQVKVLFLREMEERSGAYNGNEDPLTVKNEIMPKYRTMILDRITIDEQKTKNLLTYKTRRDLDDAYFNGRINTGQYNTERGIWEEIDAIAKKKIMIGAEELSEQQKKDIEKRRRQK